MLVGEYKENLASHKHAVRNGRSILGSSLENCGYSSLIISVVVSLKVGYSVKSETIWVNVSCSATVKSTGLSCSPNSSLTRVWSCDMVHWPLRKCWSIEWGRCSKCWTFNYILSKEAHVSISFILIRKAWESVKFTRVDTCFPMPIFTWKLEHFVISNKYYHLFVRWQTHFVLSEKMSAKYPSWNNYSIPSKKLVPVKKQLAQPTALTATRVLSLRDQRIPDAGEGTQQNTERHVPEGQDLKKL